MQHLNKLANGIRLRNSDILQLCSACCKSKSTRKPFQNLGLKASRVFEIVYADLVGPFPIETPAGNKYLLGITDKFSNYSWVYLLKFKSETPSKIKQFFQETVSQGFNIRNLTITCFSTDRGSEFMNNELKDYFQNQGVQHQSGPSYTPEFNAIQERMNRTLVEMAMALIFQSGLPMTCWGLAIETASYIRNRCPCSSNNNFLTPYEVIFQEAPDLSHLRVFGSRWYYHIPSELRNKVQPKAMEGIFAGYDMLNRSYRILPVSDPQTIVLSRDVIFDEATTTNKFLQTQSEMDYSTEISRIFDRNYENLSSTSEQSAQIIPLINPLPTMIPATAQQPRRSTRNRAQPEIFGRDYGLYSHIDSYVQQDTLAFCYKSMVEISDECPITLREAMSGAESVSYTHLTLPTKA